MASADVVWRKRTFSLRASEGCRAVACEGGLLIRPSEDCRAVACEGGLLTRPSEDCRAVACEGGLLTCPGEGGCERRRF